MPMVKLPTGAELAYEDVGKGKQTALAIHGFLGTSRTDLGTVIDWLKKEYRVIAPTLRGYGRSTPKPRTFSPDFYVDDAEDVVALMNALQLDKVHLLGYSDGGEISLILGGKYPERFHSVAVWGAVGYFGAMVKQVAQTYTPATWLKDEVKALHGITDGDAFVNEWIAAISAMVERGGDISLSLAPHFQAPLLMMLGQRDTLNPSIYAQKFLQKIPAGLGHLEMFDTAHPIHTEAPDAFRKTVGAFLKAHR